MALKRTSIKNLKPIMILLSFCFMFSRLAVLEANISFLSPYMRSKPYIAMRDVLNGGASSYRPAPKTEHESNGLVYAENLYDPQIVMNQLKSEENNVLNQRHQIQTPEMGDPIRDALLSEQSLSTAVQAGVDNNKGVQTTSSTPAFAVKTQMQANRYNHNCFFSPMNCRIWKEPLPMVNDASEIGLGVNRRLNEEGPTAEMVRRTRKKMPYQLRPQPSIWRIFRGS